MSPLGSLDILDMMAVCEVVVLGDDDVVVVVLVVLKRGDSIQDCKEGASNDERTTDGW